jgi:hypothetical protein
MSGKVKSGVAMRRRLKRQGFVRVEVHVRKEDATLVRRVADAFVDPERAPETRAVLRQRFAEPPPKGLKALLAGHRSTASTSNDRVIADRLPMCEFCGRYHWRLRAPKGIGLRRTGARPLVSGTSAAAGDVA